MIRGAHMIIYTKDPEADRAFFRDVLKWPHVDAHDGWLIFAMPPAELACHPLMDDGERHEIHLMCDDVGAIVTKLTEAGHPCDEVQDMGFGLLTHVRLPGGSKLGIYEPRHASPILNDGGGA